MATVKRKLAKTFGAEIEGISVVAEPSAASIAEAKALWACLLYTSDAADDSKRV